MDVKRAWAFVLGLCVVLCVLNCRVYADGTSEENRILESLDEMLDNTVEGESGLADGIGGENFEEWGESLTKATDIQQLIAKITSVTKDLLPSALSLLCVIFGIVILCAVCRRIGDGFNTGSVGAGMEFLSGAVVLTVALGSLAEQFDMTAKCFQRLCSLVESMIPITAMVWAMGGNVTTASVGTVTLYSILAVVQKLCASTVIPVCCVAVAAAVCSSLNEGGVLAGFTGAIKKGYNFFVGLLMTVLVFALGTQTTIAVSADTLAARGVKLLSSTVIPVVGGAVGDTLRVVSGSVSYIKSVVGIGAIVMMLYLILPTLIALLLYRLVFLVSSSLADMLGCGREGRLLSEIGNIYGCLVGAVSICSVAFVISFAIFIRCAVAAS